jgi:hypothetical protein
MRVLIPNALVPDAAWVNALLKEPLPALQTLLGMAQLREHYQQPVTRWSAATEVAKAKHFGWDPADGRYPFAAKALGTEQGAAWIHLCHWDMGHAVATMADPNQLDLSPSHAKGLFERMAPYFLEDGLQLQAHDGAPATWALVGERLRDLRSTSPYRIIGQDVRPWFATAPGVNVWGRLQSEMQMLLYTDPLNDERDAQGLPTVNAFWLSGGGAVPRASAQTASLIEALQLARLTSAEPGSAWLQGWRTLEQTVFQPLSVAIREGEAATLIFAGRDTYYEFAITQPSGWRQLWPRARPWRTLKWLHETPAITSP